VCGAAFALTLLGRRPTMGKDDKVENAMDKAAGTAKEKAGQVTDDARLETEGKAEKSSADLKQAGENVKDAVRDQ
jgi:uncharacterized protein YjbJ (UPF0337 family)